MRIIFMGSPDFAVPSLNALVEAGHEVVAAYAQPPRPAGRGKADRRTPVQQRAEQLGIEVRTPRTLRNDEEQACFREFDADLAVVAAYGLILPKPVLDAPKQGCVNVHASLLPRWRGAAPIQRAIMAGDETSGVTIMQMDEGLDTGPMLLKREMSLIGKNAGEVTKEIAKLGADALLEWIENPSPPQAQPDEGVTYAAKVGKSEARLDWSRPAAELKLHILAMAPAPTAWFEVRGERIRIFEAAEAREENVPGTVMYKDGQLLIAAGRESLAPVQVQRAGRAVMTMNELLRGFPIPEGTILA